MAVQALAGWLTYKTASSVLPCYSGWARRLLGPPRSNCLMAVRGIVHKSLVPTALMGSLVVVSFLIFSITFARTARDTRRSWSALRLKSVDVPPQLGALAAGARLGDRLVVVDQDVPTAFCIGLARPRVVLTTALLDRLSAESLLAVLAHEGSHRRRHDPLRAALARSLARALFYLPWLRDLAEGALVENEVSADADAVKLAGQDSLAAALLAMLGYPSPQGTAAMAGPEVLELRLEALETHERPALRANRRRVVLSVVMTAIVLASLAWLPYLDRDHVVVFPVHIVRPGLAQH